MKTALRPVVPFSQQFQCNSHPNITTLLLCDTPETFRTATAIAATSSQTVKAAPFSPPTRPPSYPRGPRAPPRPMTSQASPACSSQPTVPPHVPSTNLHPLQEYSTYSASTRSSTHPILPQIPGTPRAKPTRIPKLTCFVRSTTIRSSILGTVWRCSTADGTLPDSRIPSARSRAQANRM